MNTRLITGIGNPEPEYAGTRHNLGFDVVKGIAAKLKVPGFSTRFLGHFAFCGSSFGSGGLLMPETYVNNSGFSVKSACDFFEISPSSVLVITDDLHLAPGKIRFREKGSSGGHNGLKSIIDVCGTQSFPRLRIGIGAARDGDTVSHVLGTYEGEEKDILRAAVEQGMETALSWLGGGSGYNNI